MWSVWPPGESRSEPPGSAGPMTGAGDSARFLAWIRDTAAAPETVEAGSADAHQLVEDAFAFAERHSGYDLFHVETRATADGGGYRLEGEKGVVLGAATADRLIVSARTGGGARDAEEPGGDPDREDQDDRDAPDDDPAPEEETG